MFMPDANRVVDIVVSPAGCLTWASVSGDGVREVCPTGDTNVQPRAVSSADPVAGTAPLQVQFVGSQSSDPDGDVLQHSWNVGEDPVFDEVDPVHTYVADGAFDAVLTVDDGQQQANSVDSAPPLRIVVGNEAPAASIGSPTVGGTYDFGATISFAGSADDPEDGAMDGSGFRWTVNFHRGGRARPALGPLTGITSGEFTVPAEWGDVTDGFFRVHLRVADSGAPLGPSGQLATSAFVDVAPNVSRITLQALESSAWIDRMPPRPSGPSTA